MRTLGQHCALCGDIITSTERLGYWKDKQTHYNCSTAAHKVWQEENPTASPTPTHTEPKCLGSCSECRCGGACENCRDCNTGECMVGCPNQQGTLPLALNNQTKKGNEVSDQSLNENCHCGKLPADQCGEETCYKTVETMDIHLVLGHDIDGSLQIYAGGTNIDLLERDDYEDWLVTIRVPTQTLVDSRPNPRNPTLLDFT